MFAKSLIVKKADWDVSQLVLKNRWAIALSGVKGFKHTVLPGTTGREKKG